MDKMELKALAKINLGLDVLGRRENGYHDVRMVMQTIYLYDDVILEKTKEPGIRPETNLFYLPVDENNIAYKAAKLLIDEFGIKEGVYIRLNKFIPVSAGMAGGSSNAAAVLFGMNRMFSLGLSEQEPDGQRSKTWCRCSILYYAGNCFGRGDWRETDSSSCHAKMLCTDCKT